MVTVAFLGTFDARLPCFMQLPAIQLLLMLYRLIRGQTINVDDAIHNYHDVKSMVLGPIKYLAGTVHRSDNVVKDHRWTTLHQHADRLKLAYRWIGEVAH